MSPKRPHETDAEQGKARAPSTPPARPRSAGEGKGEGRRGGLRRPFVAGSATVPASPEPESQAGDAGKGEGTEREGDYIEFDFDALLAPGEIPAVLREGPAADRAAAHRAAAPGGGADDESHVYGIGEELVRLRRQLELRREEAKVLAQLQDEADSPATRDLIEAAFAAGYFAGKGELERRIGRLR